MVVNNPWEILIKREDFKESIRNKGYYAIPWSFQSMLKELGMQVKGRAPQYLSIDFWSKQSRTLTNNNFYVIRSGRGHSIIFDQEQYPAPYVNLKTDNVKEIQAELPSGFIHLQDAFSRNTLENAALEQLRFLGIYDKIMKELFGDVEYFVGPRGNRNSRFDVYFNRKDQSNPQKIFTY
ncbi:MAG: hypothetical protein QXW73_07555, partial [Nitrososphaerales archaeon]